MTDKQKNPNAVALGKMSSPKKEASSAENGKLTHNGAYYRRQIEDIRHLMNKGELDYRAAERLAAPAIAAMNKRGEALAKKFGQTFKPLTFKYLVR